MTFFGYISKEKVSSLFSYELDLRKQGCRPFYFGVSNNGKTFYALYNADKKPKGLGRNKVVNEGEFYNIPNPIKPHF
ncbi:hypothetical protein NSQ62_08045 [Solibacillus sp. FSL H8-0523]|uniref:hypothetical protein n=1 Tax=Solibacillus sp. FSL H8-0523 TaxID=2954511 RepID=UPI003101A187